MVLDVLGQTSLIRWIGIGPYLLASLVFWMHCNACEQLNAFTGCIILSSKILIIFCNKIGVSQRILFTAQKCSSYHMVKYLKKCSIYFLFQKTSVPDMLNISVLANVCAYCVISQTFPKAVKRLDLSFQGKFLY